MSNKKQFAKVFLTFFIIFTVALMPVRFAFKKVGDVRIFSGNESIMKDMGYIIDESGPYYELFSKSKRVNILVLGDNDGLTDTIMLASYDMKNQSIDVISVPRDTYFPRPKYKGAATQKINAVYGSEGAVGTAKAVSETLMGIPINYYAVIEFSDVEKIVDKIGGVPMDIPFTMKYDDPYDKPPLHIYIEKGPQTLDGKKAVQFLRYRKGYAEGDIGRVKAQQDFIKSAVKQAISPNLPSVVKLGLEEIDSDITLGMATKIATKAIGLDPENMKTYLLPGAPKTVNGASYWFADTTEIEKIIEEIYDQNRDKEIEEDTE
ncbi:MAG: LCP family protein [Aminipila sp.]